MSLKAQMKELAAEVKAAEAARNEAVRCNRKVQVTYHRAFDMLDDQFAALDTLIELGFTRVNVKAQCLVSKHVV